MFLCIWFWKWLHCVVEFHAEALQICTAFSHSERPPSASQWLSFRANAEQNMKTLNTLHPPFPLSIIRLVQSLHLCMQYCRFTHTHAHACMHWEGCGGIQCRDRLRGHTHPSTHTKQSSGYFLLVRDDLTHTDTHSGINKMASIPHGTSPPHTHPKPCFLMYLKKNKKKTFSSYLRYKYTEFLVYLVTSCTYVIIFT